MAVFCYYHSMRTEGILLSLDPDSFFLIILITVLVIRVILHGAAVGKSKFQRSIVPKPVIKNVRIHHYVYGIILCVVAVLIKRLDVMAIGLGFVIDEVWFVIRLQSDDNKYLSYSSLVGTFAILLLLYFFRVQIFETII